MSTQAKKNRKRYPTPKVRDAVHARKEHRVRDRRETNNSTIRPNPNALVRLPESLDGKQNHFEIASAFGGYSVYSTVKNQVNLLPYLNKVCLTLFPEWKNVEWPEDTPLHELFGTMVRKICAWGREQYTSGKGELYWASVYDEHEGYWFVQTAGDEQTKFCYMDFLPDLEKVDPKLMEIILIVIGKMIDRYGLGDWNDTYRMANEWIFENGMLEDMDEDERKNAEDDLKEWKEGDAMKYFKRMQKLSRTSMTALRKKIRAYKWNTYHKKRILTWIRFAERIYTQYPKATLNKYGWENSDYDASIYPSEYMMFRWDMLDSNVIDYHFTQWYQERWNNEQISRFKRAFDISKQLPPSNWNDDKFPEWIDSWMAYSCFLFHREFMRDYKGKNNKRLITKLL